MPPASNDPTIAERASHSPDPHGQAALLLVESLLHDLIGKKLLTVAGAIDVINVACEVKQELADEMGDTRSTYEQSLALLSAMRRSMETDEIAPTNAPDAGDQS